MRSRISLFVSAVGMMGEHGEFSPFPMLDVAEYSKLVIVTGFVESFSTQKLKFALLQFGRIKAVHRFHSFVLCFFVSLVLIRL